MVECDELMDENGRENDLSDLMIENEVWGRDVRWLLFRTLNENGMRVIDELSYE